MDQLYLGIFRWVQVLNLQGGCTGKIQCKHILVILNYDISFLSHSYLSIVIWWIHQY